MSRGTYPGPITPKPASSRPAHGRQLRPRLDSLYTQMALGSALVALAAVTLVTLGSLVGLSLSERNQVRSQLTVEVSQIASALGRGDHIAGASDPFISSTSTGGIGNHQTGSVLTPVSIYVVWVMDAAGRVTLYSPALASKLILRDKPTLNAALHRALLGQVTEGALPDNASGLQALLAAPPPRLYAAVPVRRGDSSTGAIISAVALSSPPTLSPPAADSSQGSARSGGNLSLSPGGVSIGTLALPTNQFILVLALVATLLAAAAALLFVRRLTNPLDRIMAATARMGSGDYTARISVRAPVELRELASTFNTMAATIERDVSELHRQEDLRRELVANVSHDLATPLTMIRGFTETLASGGLHIPQRREELTAIIGREAARLQRLVDQLREVALLEAGAQVLQCSAFHLPTSIEETVAVLEPALEEKRVILSNRVPPDLPTVVADSDRITEVLFNLLDNAVRHTPPGGRIEVDAAVVGQFVRIGIADEGPGIPLAQRERVFERFFRVDASRSSVAGGSGLGLAIVKAIVEAHGGTIGVEAGPEGGAAFEFTLPIQCQSSVG